MWPAAVVALVVVAGASGSSLPPPVFKAATQGTALASSGARITAAAACDVRVADVGKKPRLLKRYGFCREDRLDSALARWEQVQGRYHLSLLTRIQHIRIDLALLEARLALETACRNPTANSKWLRRAGTCLVKLKREKMPYADALAAYIQANLAWAGQICGTGTPASDLANLLCGAAESLARADLQLLSKAADRKSTRLNSSH